jgi:flagellar FliL protein
MKITAQNYFAIILMGLGLIFIVPGHAAHADEKADKDAKAGGEYVELQPLILPVIGSNGLSQTVSLMVAIQVGNSSDAQKVASIAPRLQDAYIQDMYGVLSTEASMNEVGAIHVKALKERLTYVSRNVAGDIVEDVLLQVVQQRPL